MTGRPAGLPNKCNRAAAKLLQEAQERVARGLIEMTEPMRHGEKCPFCGQGMPRPEDTRIKASTEVLDRGGTPKISRVEVGEAPDTAWMQFLPEDKLELLSQWIEDAKALMPAPEIIEIEAVSPP